MTIAKATWAQRIDLLLGIVVVAALAVGNLAAHNTVSAACGKECGYEGELDRGEREDCSVSCKWVWCGQTTLSCIEQYGFQYAQFNDHCFSWLECAPIE
jgi:hypothetical protein